MVPTLLAGLEQRGARAQQHQRLEVLDEKVSSDEVHHRSCREQASQQRSGRDREPSGGQRNHQRYDQGEQREIESACRPLAARNEHRRVSPIAGHGHHRPGVALYVVPPVSVLRDCHGNDQVHCQTVRAYLGPHRGRPVGDQQKRECRQAEGRRRRRCPLECARYGAERGVEGSRLDRKRQCQQQDVYRPGIHGEVRKQTENGLPNAHA
jgi:hypothetical protein